MALPLAARCRCAAQAVEMKASLSSGLIHLLFSLAKPQDYGCKSIGEINRLEGDQRGLDEEDYGDKFLGEEKGLVQKLGWDFTSTIVVIWPLLSLPASVLPKDYWSMWVFISIVWASNVAWQYGVSGPFWYASGATIQVLISRGLAIEVKRRARTARKVCEMVLAHWGKAAHISLMLSCLLTNIIVTAVLLLGGAATVNALTGMIYLASFLIPWGVLLYKKNCEQFGKCVKLGVYEEYLDRMRIFSEQGDSFLETSFAAGKYYFFNWGVLLIWVPVQIVWKVPLGAARLLGVYAPYFRLVARVYITGTFVMIPGVFMGSSAVFGFYKGLETVRGYTKGECRRIFLEQGSRFLETSLYESGKYACGAVQDNMEGSYLMMLSGVGLKIWIINVMAEATAQEKAAMGLVRWGKAARTSYIFFCFLAKLSVFNMLLLANEVVQRYAESDALQTEVVHRYVEDEVTEEEIEEVFDIDGNGILVLRVRGGMQINVEKLKGRRYLTADLVRGRTQGDGEEYYMPMLFNFGEGGSRAPVSARVTVSFEYRGGYTMLSTSLRGGSRAPVSARVTV